jgi:uncharacterized protein YbjT (DUF2867 family)
MDSAKKLIVVTGATGKQGGAVARELLARHHKVRAVTRQPEGDAAKALARLGAEVVAGDLVHVESLRKALSGAWGVFAVQNTWEAGVEREEEQGKRIATVAREMGVQHYVYTSVASAHRETTIPHFENKWRVEEKVRSLQFPSYTILRPVFFMENLASPMLLPSIQEGKLALAVEPETVLQMIAVADIGKHGLRAFEKHAELNGQAIDIAGDQLTMPAVAEILTRLTTQKVSFVQVPIEAVRAASEDYATMLEWFVRVGYDVDIERLAKESGIRPTSFASWAATVDWAPAHASR